MAELYDEEPSEEGKKELAEESAVSLKDIKVADLDVLENLFKNTNLTAKEIVLSVQCLYLCKLRNELIISSEISNNIDSVKAFDVRMQTLVNIARAINAINMNFQVFNFDIANVTQSNI